MKNTILLKSALFHSVLFTAVIIITTSCSNTGKAADLRDAAEVKNEAELDSINKITDAQFLTHAALINLEEIKYGQLAQRNGTLKDVKALGKMMEAAHTKGLNDITAIALQKGISIPSSANNEIEDTYQKLSKKTGDEFDKEYCNMMVTGHHAAIEVFEKASVETIDTDIKAWAIITLPELHTHLEHAIACQKQIDKKELILAKTNKKN